MNVAQPATSLPTLLLVDDEPLNLQVLRHTLQDDYRLLFARDGARALELVASEKPDMVLLDVMMPGMTGHEVCRVMRATPGISHIPVIFVSALADSRSEGAGFEAGGVDYISKPVSPPIVRARVRTHLSLVRVEELLHTRLQIVQRLGLAAEYKDNETGMHVMRMSHYAQILARAAGLSERDAENLLHAAPMHDIGKIGIPDAILRKNGKLEPDEWEVMRRHVEIGVRIIGEHPGGVLATARIVALTHHEKWDGLGYPQGLSGEEIPLEGRIVAIADVFDALTSERPYKHAWPLEEALALMREQAGRHFDPTLVALFLQVLPAILEVRNRFPEDGTRTLDLESLAL
ncbi:response regulator [Xylophilus sp. Kf1]|nr:response regulator [Xylophilus sp. Kf1]